MNEIVDSPLDGQEIFYTLSPAFFGVIVGITEDGAAYAVEALNLPGQPIIFLAADGIEEHFAEAVIARNGRG